MDWQEIPGDWLPVAGRQYRKFINLFIFLFITAGADWPEELWSRLWR